MATPQQPERTTGMVLAEQPAPPVKATETSSSAVAAREKAAVEARFLVALHRPRNPDLARQRVIARCQSPAFAEVAEYSKPIGTKKVTGGSIRLMEELGRQWGNIDVRSDITFDDLERRIIHVSCTDLESNYSQSTDVILEKTVERKLPREGEAVIKSRVNSKGEVVYLIEADEDQFLVKQNANVAKARREMIRAVIPGDLVEEALDIAQRTRKNEDAKDPAEARKRIADLFFRYGVMANQLCEYLEKPSLEAITPAELEVLRSLYTAMKEGETTWAEIMADKRPTQNADAPAAAPGKGTQGLKDALSSKSKVKGILVRIVGGTTVQYQSATEAWAAINEGKITPIDDAEADRISLAVDAERTS